MTYVQRNPDLDPKLVELYEKRRELRDQKAVMRAEIDRLTIEVERTTGKILYVQELIAEHLKLVNGQEEELITDDDYV